MDWIKNNLPDQSTDSHMSQSANFKNNTQSTSQRNRKNRLNSKFIPNNTYILTFFFSKILQDHNIKKSSIRTKYYIKIQ